jgi:hypothetical protein
VPEIMKPRALRKAVRRVGTRLVFAFPALPLRCGVLTARPCVGNGVPPARSEGVPLGYAAKSGITDATVAKEETRERVAKAVALEERGVSAPLTGG